MASNFFYVYILKDPRNSPALPFYVGKGTGSRASDHLIKPDKTFKHKRILEIRRSGMEPIVDIAVDDLTEIQALKIEAQLISAFGTIQNGGILTNMITPSGKPISKKTKVIPHGAIEKAQLGLELIKKSILELIKTNPDGITNSDAAGLLGLRSDYQGNQKDYLSYSILGLLLKDEKIKIKKINNRSYHVKR